ncbi:MAG TPA: hypothetical protein VFN35_21180 [Ktedonobacteraceae bacterium]|nr:hypothetical protein [Ktedonobacteraceae bacterium]
MLHDLTFDLSTDTNDLSALTLYCAEIARLPLLSRQEQPIWVHQARQGDQDARHRLILNCLHWGMIKAFGIYQERRPSHIDVLDLMEEANLAMLEQVGKALEARDPVAYLMAIATQAMCVYCTYHAPLIQRPEWFSRIDLQALNKVLPAPDWLDETLDLEAPALDLEGGEQQEHRYRVHFRAFYAALWRLPEHHRSLLIRLYGLCGQPTETPSELAQHWQRRPRDLYAAASRARRQFAKVLMEPAPASA